MLSGGRGFLLFASICSRGLVEGFLCFLSLEFGPCTTGSRVAFESLFHTSPSIQQEALCVAQAHDVPCSVELGT